MWRDDFFTEFDAIFVGLARRARTVRFEPNADVFVSDDGSLLVVKIEIAEADPAELRVGIEGRHLMILGRRSDRDRTGRGSVLMKEIEYGDFAKKINLPMAIEYHDASAAYQDGMLTIRLPIAEMSHVPSSRTEIRMTVRRIPA